MQDKARQSGGALVYDRFMHGARVLAIWTGWLLFCIATASPAAVPTPGPIPTPVPASTPWGEVTGERLTHSTNRAATTIKNIDGLGIAERQPRVRPGTHTITVHWTPRGSLKTSDRTLRLEVKACKRYYINAQFASPGSSLWQPVVDRIDDIPGCKVPGAATETPATKPPAKGERS